MPPESARRNSHVVITVGHLQYKLDRQLCTPKLGRRIFADVTADDSWCRKHSARHRYRRKLLLAKFMNSQPSAGRILKAQQQGGQLFTLSR